MKYNTRYPYPKAPLAVLAAACAALVLSACGGGDGGGATGPDASTAALASAGDVATGTTVVQMQGVALSSDVSDQIMQPTFHVAPVLLDAPPDLVVAATPNGTPHRSVVPVALRGLPSQRLTAAAMQATLAGTQSAPSAVVPMASGSVVATYTPAQIRAAYGLPALPASFSGLTAAQAAQWGAGQTIYIVDAQHDPNAAAELAAFNAKFALPACSTKTIAPTASRPLAAASASACEFSVVYATASGAMTSTAPAYNAGWATEITLDVQWAHATAPLARIILIEAPDASLNSLLGAIQVANSLGQGVVSMSFGAPEGNWTASVDAYFAAPGMTYLAATGDNGAGVSWPSVSPNVVAVGGTTLTYSGSGARSEVSWSGTGGGTSAYSATPSYQSTAVPGMGNVAHRTVADVAFNADPATGQYVVTMAPGSTTQNWLSVGGTSLSTPQWAGLMAIANATRAVAGKAPMGAPHGLLYQQIASTPSSYASVFADVTRGTDGTCAICTAKTGYDPLSGLGTPNAGNLVSALSGAAVAPMAPVVNSSSVNGQVGTALSFTVSASAANPLIYSLSGAPAGMAISSAGVVSWAAPVAGTYSVTVVAKDSKTLLSGQGVYTVVIAAPTAPTVAPATITGKPGTALAYVVSVTATNPVTYTLAGAPAGMLISSTGTLGWASPVVGNYNVTVTARDSKTGLTGSAVLAVKIAAATTVAGPVITASPISGAAGVALSANIVISDPGVTGLQVSISGVPLGMGFTANGLNLTATWARPVAGNYSLLVQVLDSAGRSAQLAIPVTIK